jgi:hypothetical protein
VPATTLGAEEEEEMNILTARTVALALGFFLLVGCVPEDSKPRNQGERFSVSDTALI